MPLPGADFGFTLPEERTIRDRRRGALVEAWLRELDAWLSLEASANEAGRLRLCAFRLGRGDSGGARQALAGASTLRGELATMADLLATPSSRPPQVTAVSHCARQLADLWFTPESDEAAAQQAANSLRSLGAGPPADGLVLAERLSMGSAHALTGPKELEALAGLPSGALVLPGVLRLSVLTRDGDSLMAAGRQYYRLLRSKEAQVAVAAASCLSTARLDRPLAPCLDVGVTVLLTILHAAAAEPLAVQLEVLTAVPPVLRSRAASRPSALLEAADVVSTLSPDNVEVGELLQLAATTSPEGAKRLLAYTLAQGRSDRLAGALRALATHYVRLAGLLEVAASLAELGPTVPTGADPDPLSVGLGLVSLLGSGDAGHARALLESSPDAFRAPAGRERIARCLETVEQGKNLPSSADRSSVLRRRVRARRRQPLAARAARARAFVPARAFRRLRDVALPPWILRGLEISARRSAEPRVAAARLARRVSRALSGSFASWALTRAARRGSPAFDALLASLVLHHEWDEAAELLQVVPAERLRRHRAAVLALGRLGLWSDLAELLLQSVEASAGAHRARALINVGLIYERYLERVPDALGCYKEAYDLAHIAAPSWYWVEYLRREQQAEPLAGALFALASTLPSVSDRVEAYIEAARLCRDDLRDGARATLAAERARALAPQDGRVLFMLGGLYETLADWTRFVEVTEAHLRLPLPHDALATLHHRLACGYEAGLGHLEAAERHYREALRYDQSPIIRQGLRALLERMNRWGDVVEQLRAELPMWKAPAERASLLTRIGDICRQRLGDNDAAREAYNEAIRDDPMSVAANRALLELCLDTGSWNEAYEISAFLVRTSGARITVPDLCSLLTVRAQLAARLRSPKEAFASLALAMDLQPQEPAHIDSFLDILERNPNEPVDPLLVERALTVQREQGTPLGRARARLLAGMARAREGDVDAAEEHIRQAIELDAELLRARHALAALLGALGRGREAIDLWTSWLADAGPGRSTKLVRAAVRWVRRWTDELGAEQAVREWLSILPGSNELTMELAELLAARGDPQAIPTSLAAVQGAKNAGVRAAALHARLSLARGASFELLFRRLEEERCADPEEWMAVGAVATSPADKVSVLARALAFVPERKDQARIRRALAAALEEAGDFGQVAELLRTLDPASTEWALEVALARMRAELRAGGDRPPGAKPPGWSNALETLDYVVSMDPFYVPGLREAARWCLVCEARDLGLRLLDVIAVTDGLTAEEAEARTRLRHAVGLSPPIIRVDFSEQLSPVEEELRSEPFDVVWQEAGRQLLALSAPEQFETYPLPAFDSVTEQVSAVLGSSPGFLAADCDEVRFSAADNAVLIPVDAIDKTTDTDLLFLAGWLGGISRVVGPEIAGIPVNRRFELLSALDDMFRGRALPGAPTKKEIEIVSAAAAGTSGRPSPRRWWNLLSAEAAQLGLMLSGDLGTAMRWLVEIGGAEYDTASLIRFSDPTVRLVKYYLSPGYLEWRRRSGAWTA